MTKSTLPLKTLSLCAVLLTPIAATSSMPVNEHGIPVSQFGEVADDSKISRLLQKVFSAPLPRGFQQVDVSARVRAVLPTGKTRSTVLEALKTVSSSKIVIDSPEELVVRANKGRAMLDPDAGSVVMAFSFDEEGKLSGVRAFNSKSQKRQGLLEPVSDHQAFLNTNPLP